MKNLLKRLSLNPYFKNIFLHSTWNMKPISCLSAFVKQNQHSIQIHICQFWYKIASCVCMFYSFLFVLNSITSVLFGTKDPLSLNRINWIIIASMCLLLFPAIVKTFLSSRPILPSFLIYIISECQYFLCKCILASMTTRLRSSIRPLLSR